MSTQDKDKDCPSDVLNTEVAPKNKWQILNKEEAEFFCI